MLRAQQRLVEQALTVGLPQLHRVAELFEYRPCTSVSAHSVVDAAPSLHVPDESGTPSCWSNWLYSFDRRVAALGDG